jgi:hypothetical protein
MAKTLIASVSFAASLAMAVHAMALQFVTLATNDPHDYQPLLQAGLMWSALAIVLLVIFVLLVKNRWRWAGLLPVAICGVTWWGIAKLWPYAFA